MNPPQYALLTSNDFKQFDFISEGPNGRILKTVLFTPIEPGFYNLGFGDVSLKPATLTTWRCRTTAIRQWFCQP
ncbi:MAG: hypothetical protein LH606_18370 [Cytophagaceae bacterium]|nr:hypothetical protein [Cytophagaceae bacterium]